MEVESAPAARGNASAQEARDLSARQGSSDNNRRVFLLEADPDLGDSLPEDQVDVARRQIAVSTKELSLGPWTPEEEKELGPDDLGYLLWSGLITRELQIDTGKSIELLGPGDLLRPWQEDAASFCEPHWQILEETRLLILDGATAQRLRYWPGLSTALVERAIRRSRRLAAQAAMSTIVGLEKRVLILLWHLAESWGAVTPDGVVLKLKLPRRILAELIGARRPSVSTALSELQRSGKIATGEHGWWLLLGDPPC